MKFKIISEYELTDELQDFMSKVGELWTNLRSIRRQSEDIFEQIENQLDNIVDKNMLERLKEQIYKTTEISDSLFNKQVELSNSILNLIYSKNKE